MKKALLIYSSTDGQTIKILEHIAKEVAPAFESELVNLDCIDTVAWQQYDRVIIGASVRYGHLSKQLYKFIQKHLASLNEHKVAFFCVNLTARKPGKDSVQGSVYMQTFLKKSPWQPKLMAVFAGALLYPRYKLVDRLMIQLIMRITGGETDSSKEVEYTDWAKVTDFARQFCSF